MLSTNLKGRGIILYEVQMQGNLQVCWKIEVVGLWTGSHQNCFIWRPVSNVLNDVVSCNKLTFSRG